jgi:hypothetical protein
VAVWSRQADRWADETFALALFVIAGWSAARGVWLLVDMARGDVSDVSRYGRGYGYASKAIGVVLSAAIGVVTGIAGKRMWRGRPRIRTKLIFLAIALSLLVTAVVWLSVWPLAWLSAVVVLTAVSLALDFGSGHQLPQ